MTKFNFCENISLNDKNHQEEKEKSRLEYFDGIRGSLALSVLFRHGFLYYGLSKDFPFFWQLGNKAFHSCSSLSIFRFYLNLLFRTLLWSHWIFYTQFVLINTWFS